MSCLRGTQLGRCEGNAFFCTFSRAVQRVLRLYEASVLKLRTAVFPNVLSRRGHQLTHSERFTHLLGFKRSSLLHISLSAREISDEMRIRLDPENGRPFRHSMRGHEARPPIQLSWAT